MISSLTPTAKLLLQDCITGMAGMDPGIVDLIVTSIPFEELFTYSGKLQDVGNNGSTVDIREGRFALNMRFVIQQMYRTLRPGCNACIHIQQLLAYQSQHGFIGRRDFRGAVIDLFRAGGFNFYGEIAIPKDPQVMAQRLSLMSLQFKTARERGGQILAPAPNDYVLIFKKPGELEYPCLPLHDPKRNPTGWMTQEEWILWARGVWEIDAMDILQDNRHARENDEEKHVCCLQLELIRRLIKLYSNPVSLQPNVLVGDPFMGIGSTAHEAILLERNVFGFELKESYHGISLKNVERAFNLRAERDTPKHDLFSGLLNSELQDAQKPLIQPCVMEDGTPNPPPDGPGIVSLVAKSESSPLSA
jgi:DNA modification methylase